MRSFIFADERARSASSRCRRMASVTASMTSKRARVAEGLADRGPTDPELADQLTLGGQPFSRRHRPFQDRPTDLARDVHVDGRARDAVEAGTLGHLN